MTLWDAYQTANRRRAAMNVGFAPDAGLRNGRTEQSLRVSPHLIGGNVMVQQGTSSDWITVPPSQARTVEVTR